MLLQYWDGDVRDLHAPRPWYRVRLTHKKSGVSWVVRLSEGMEHPVQDDINDYTIKNLGVVTDKDN